MEVFLFALGVVVLIAIVLGSGQTSERKSGRQIVAESQKRDAQAQHSAEQARNDALAEHDAVFRKPGS